MRTLRDELPAIVLACIAGLCFALFIWLIRELPLVGMETQAAQIVEEVATNDAAEQFTVKLLHIRHRLALQDKKLRKLQRQAAMLEKLLVEPEPTPEPEPILETQANSTDLHIVPQTDIDDFNACYDELIRRGISECGGEPYMGMLAVFQVMYDRMYNMNAGYESIHDMLSIRNAFAAPYEGDISPWEAEISKACKAVFLDGERAFGVVTKYFYNPKYSSPEGIAFMEAQAYVGTIGNHTFCTEWKYVEGTSDV